MFKTALVGTAFGCVFATIIAVNSDPIKNYNLPEIDDEITLDSRQALFDFIDNDKLRVVVNKQKQNKVVKKKIIQIPRTEINCLADNIFFEARGESLKGQNMVATVTFARVKSWRWPNNICKVVHQKKQFSWTSISLNERNIMIEKEKHLYHKIRNRLVKSINNLSKTNSDIYHYARFDVSPKWAKNMKAVKTIGAHVFYR